MRECHCTFDCNCHDVRVVVIERRVPTLAQELAALSHDKQYVRVVAELRDVARKGQTHYYAHDLTPRVIERLRGAGLRVDAGSIQIKISW